MNPIVDSSSYYNGSPIFATIMCIIIFGSIFLFILANILRRNHLNSPYYNPNKVGNSKVNKKYLPKRDSKGRFTC